MTMPPVGIGLYTRFPTAGFAKMRLLPEIDPQAAATIHAWQIRLHYAFSKRTFGHYSSARR